MTRGKRGECECDRAALEGAESCAYCMRETEE